LPGLSANEFVSAINYVNSDLIYAGTTLGKVYRLAKSGTTWTAVGIHAAPLPVQWIWDIAARSDNANTVVLVMSGFGIAHVWRGAITGTGTAWTNISGTGAGTLPDIPVNALAIDPAAPDSYYIGTDVGMFRTSDAGQTWTEFSEGLPNCAIFDLRLHHPMRLLRAATHGRGLWERKLDVTSMPDVDLYFRDHLMATGRSPTTEPLAAFEDPLQHVALGETLRWWQCADIKVDALEGSPPDYQMPVSAVDYVAFESKLEHRYPKRGQVNRVYVQMQNRGIAPAANVTIKLLYRNASAGSPPLPPDFWTAFPNDSSDTSVWTPIDVPQVVPSLSPGEPVVLEWEWTTPSTASRHSCLLAVMDSPSDPIPAASKVFDVSQLARDEKRVGLKNLDLVDLTPGTTAGIALEFHRPTGQAQTIKVLPTQLHGWSLGWLLPRAAPATGRSQAIKREHKRSKKGAAGLEHQGWVMKRLTRAAFKRLREEFGTDLDKFDTTVAYMVKNGSKGAQLEYLRLPKAGLRLILIIAAPRAGKASATVTVTQEESAQIVGGNTFVLRVSK
jgi:hypothetical protein